MSRSSVCGVIALATSLALTACAASHVTPPTGAALAALIRSNPLGPMTPGWKASCVGHSCTVAWDEPGFNARGAWVIAFPEVDGIDGDERFLSVHHLDVKIADPNSERIWVIACELTHKSAKAISTTPIATYPSGMRKFCVERERPLSY
jgi:hypothetical protein